MRILHANKFLFRAGGAESYLLELSAVQARSGHQIAHFAMSHTENQPSEFERFFPSQASFRPAPDSRLGKVKLTGRLLYSPSARKGMEQVIRQFRPDVVHLHNIYHHLSPSILRPLAARRIPAVMTLHDYKLACPTYGFFANGRPCEACLGGRFYWAVIKRCNDGSMGASAVNALELTLHTATRAYAPVHLFACPSRFMLQKMTSAGVFPDRLRWIPLFVEAKTIVSKEQPGGGVVFVGRLSGEKGVDVLIQAAAGVGMPLDIAGEGPNRSALEKMSRRLGANVRFHGRLPRSKVLELIRSSSVLALPSRSYENQPLAVLEAFACGVPVVASDIGGIPELIQPGEDGFLVDPGDVGGFARVLAKLVDRPGRALEMGRAGRWKVETQFSPEKHTRRLEALYEEAASLAGRRR